MDLLIKHLRENLRYTEFEERGSISTNSKYLSVDGVLIRVSDHYSSSENSLRGVQIIKPSYSSIDDLYVVFYKNTNIPMLMSAYNMIPYISTTIVNINMEKTLAKAKMDIYKNLTYKGERSSDTDGGETNNTEVDNVEVNNTETNNAEANNAEADIAEVNNAVTDVHNENVGETPSNKLLRLIAAHWGRILDKPIVTWQRLGCLLGTLPQYAQLSTDNKNYIRDMYEKNVINARELKELTDKHNNKVDFFRGLNELVVSRI